MGGCNVFFNGRTGKVSSYFLAKLVEEHGGTVGSAFTKTRITHIVATNLNGSKADKVLKSVKKQKREPEFEYLVYKQDNAVASAKSLLTPSNIGKQNLNDVDGSAMDQRSKRGY
ncbi:TPA: hypothetical protein N0F65_011641 [Lagenidium giganteum]|uniref:BRCT domain-containing protein n=1 Tax=Lagenidium giganteum TaxID=4803 RepID=A0AAV2ZD53_9STRA|nr:TPA: hypothetical protein N0F65_011641 [Lagenidium giganteum]